MCSVYAYKMSIDHDTFCDFHLEFWYGFYGVEKWIFLSQLILLILGIFCPEWHVIDFNSNIFMLKSAQYEIEMRRLNFCSFYFWTLDRISPEDELRVRNLKKINKFSLVIVMLRLCCLPLIVFTKISVKFRKYFHLSRSNYLKDFIPRNERLFFRFLLNILLS